MSKVISFSAAIARRKAKRNAANLPPQQSTGKANAPSWCDLAKRPDTLGALAAIIGAPAPRLHSAR